LQVSSEIEGLPESTRETVEGDTFASFATSFIVTFCNISPPVQSFA